jgi:hypothetical protein
MLQATPNEPCTTGLAKNPKKKKKKKNKPCRSTVRNLKATEPELFKKPTLSLVEHSFHVVTFSPLQQHWIKKTH